MRCRHVVRSRLTPEEVDLLFDEDSFAFIVLSLDSRQRSIVVHCDHLFRALRSTVWRTATLSPVSPEFIYRISRPKPQPEQRKLAAVSHQTAKPTCKISSQTRITECRFGWRQPSLELAEFLHGAFDGGFHRGHITDVCLDRDPPPLLRFDQLSSFSEIVRRGRRINQIRRGDGAN